MVSLARSLHPSLNVPFRVRYTCNMNINKEKRLLANTCLHTQQLIPVYALVLRCLCTDYSLDLWITWDGQIAKAPPDSRWLMISYKAPPFRKKLVIQQEAIITDIYGEEVLGAQQCQRHSAATYDTSRWNLRAKHRHRKWVFDCHHPLTLSLILSDQTERVLWRWRGQSGNICVA